MRIDHGRYYFCFFARWVGFSVEARGELLIFMSQFQFQLKCVHYVSTGGHQYDNWPPGKACRVDFGYLRHFVSLQSVQAYT